MPFQGVNVDIAKSGYLPTLQGSTGIGSNGKPDYQLSVSQPILDWGRTKADVARAKFERESATHTVDDEREKAALEAAQAYISVKRNEDIVRAAEDNLAAHTRFSKLARERVQGGVGDNSEVELSGIHQSEAASELEDASGYLRNAKSVFLSKVGYEPGKLGDIPELSLSLGDITDVRAAASLAPAAAAALAKGEAAKKAQAVEKAGLFPTVTADAYINHSIGTGSATTTGIGLRLALPTFKGFSNFRRVEAAELQADSARWNAETAIRKAVDDVRAFQDKAPTLKAKVRILDEQLRRAKALRSVYEDQFKLGERTLSDLVSVQASIYSIERSRIEARYGVSDLQYGAAAALGKLEQQLGLVASNGEQGS